MDPRLSQSCGYRAAVCQEWPHVWIQWWIAVAGESTWMTAISKHKMLCSHLRASVRTMLYKDRHREASVLRMEGSLRRRASIFVSGSRQKCTQKTTQRPYRRKKPQRSWHRLTSVNLRKWKRASLAWNYSSKPQCFPHRRYQPQTVMYPFLLSVLCIGLFMSIFLMVLMLWPLSLY